MARHLLICALLVSSCLISNAFAQESPKPARAAGRVEAVSAESLTLALPGGSTLSVRIEGTTKVTGRGAEARGSREGGKAITDLVRSGDSAVITYVGDTAADRKATEVHVRLLSK